MCVVEYMKVLTVKPIPVPAKWKHPPPPNDALPRHEFTMGLIAPKGAGKTTVICNLLNFYKGYFHNILVFSPTVASDEKWDWVKEQKLLSQNKPLIDFVNKKKKREFNGIVEGAQDENEFDGLVESFDPDFDGKIPEECFLADYDEKTLQEIMDEQMKVVKLLKKYKKSKHLANRILIIFDDLVGSSLFSAAKNNPFKKLNTTHRHYSCSMLMVSQGYKEIPKTVRTNWSCLLIFEIPNDKEIEVIYEEFPMGLKRDQWMQVYEYAVNGDHDFFFMNYQKEKRLRMMKNFDEVLFYDT
jgi:hypothetical protein